MGGGAGRAGLGLRTLSGLTILPGLSLSSPLERSLSPESGADLVSFFKADLTSLHEVESTSSTAGGVAGAAGFASRPGAGLPPLLEDAPLEAEALEDGPLDEEPLGEDDDLEPEREVDLAEADVRAPLGLLAYLPAVSATRSESSIHSLSILRSRYFSISGRLKA